MSSTYQSSGVSISLGNEASKILYEAAKLTWENRKGKLGEVIEVFPDFSGVRAIHVGGLPQGTYMNIGFDGVGTKVELGERASMHNTLAYDLFAMVCDDAVAKGAEPVIVGSILDVNTLQNKTSKVSYIDFVKQMAIGYVNAAKEANVAIVNGEVAELGVRVMGYGPFNYNWGAAAVWFARKERFLTGRKIQEGDHLVGLREDGFRSNGLSLLRKVLGDLYGDKWHLQTFSGKKLAELTLHPSRIYTGAVVDMFGGLEREPKARVFGIAHITGGGIPEKLGRLLTPNNLGAVIDDPFKPCDLMLFCQEKGFVSDKEAYSAWNMGQGMIIATTNPDEVLDVAKQHEIDAKVIGTVTGEKGIRIKSRGFYNDKEKELVFQG
ncbi:AIR synthase-related protein [Elusimicrobiota bacterium]